MKTAVFYYTGTGNSLWAARYLASDLSEAVLLPMTRNKVDISRFDAIGFVFPVHYWGVPRHVLDFLNDLPLNITKYYFALAVSGGQVAATLLQLKKYMLSKGLELHTGFEIIMPSNYIPWSGPISKEKQEERFVKAKSKIKKVAELIKSKTKQPMEKGALWENILFPLIYKMIFPGVPKYDKNFWVDDKCNACAICAKICPVQNIKMIDAKPTWLHNCEQCLACIQWCPQQSIQFGKKTPKYERYHQPDIKVKDLLPNPKYPY